MRSSVAVVAVAGALAATPVGAQGLPPVQQRIDGVFQNLPENPAELAIPLSRRALARRASVLPYLSEQVSDALEGFDRLQKPAAPAHTEQSVTASGSAEPDELLEAEEGSTDLGAEAEAVRIPRPRPDPMAVSSSPIDLVAAPAASDEDEAEPDLVAAAADSPGEAPPEEDVAAATPPADAPEPVPESAPESAPKPAGERTRDAATSASDSDANLAAPDTEVAAADKAPPAKDDVPGEQAAKAQAAATTEIAKLAKAAPAGLPEPDPATIAALGSAKHAPPEEARSEDAPLEQAPSEEAQSEDAPSEDAPAAWVPPPRPARDGDKATPEPGAEVVAAAARPVGPCLAPDKVADRDKDFSRNADELKEEGFCISEQKFKERKRPWTVQTVTSGKPGPLWAVLHDDENESFDTAVYALQTYGGVLVTLDTGGKRNQDGIDPNRNFSDDEISCPKLGKSAAPKFTEVFKKLIDPSQPIVALHNNFDGPVPTKGLGHVSMSTVPKDMRKVASKNRKGPLAGEHALLLLAASEPVDESSKTRMQDLAGRGLNVVLEPVRKGKGDCSLSNYAVLSGHEDYFNVTVHHDEGEKQRKMIDAIMTGFPTVSASR